MRKAATIEKLIDAKTSKEDRLLGRNVEGLLMPLGNII